MTSLGSSLSARDEERRRRRRKRIARTAVISLAFVGGMAGALTALGERAADGAERDTLAERQMPPEEPPARIERADIVDANGVTLATGITTYELYLDSRYLETTSEKQEAADAISAAFPDLSEGWLLEKMGETGGKLLRRPLTPREAQAAHDLGIPGLFLTPRRDRLYPAGAITAHVVGWTNVDGEGAAGVEAARDELLQTGGAPLQLTIDLRVQTAVREILAGAMATTRAKAAAGIVMDVRTGAVRGLVSLPDYDPHRRPPQPKTAEENEASPLFHRAVAGGYELGSVMKTLTWALALETGVAEMDSVFDASEPLEIRGYTIADDHPMGAHVGFERAFAGSSNIVAATLALEAGQDAQERMFRALGLKDETGVEQIEARGVAPRWASPWNDLASATAAYGHGVALTPMHLAALGSNLLNGGHRIRPTILADGADDSAPSRVVSPETSAKMAELLRAVVTKGTGRRADAPGLEVGGKTGTADKPSKSGGYHEDKVVATFLSAFPMSRPRFVVVVTLDEPEILDRGERKRGASLTAAPAARTVIERVAPLLGVGAAVGG